MSKGWIAGGVTSGLIVAGALVALRFTGTRSGLPAAGSATPVMSTPTLAPIHSGTPTTAPASPAPAPGIALSPDTLFAAASPGVALIQVSNFLAGSLKQGTGFFVSPDGLLVTNYHVIEAGVFATVTTSDGTRLVVQGVVAVNEKADLALLKIDPAGHVLTVLRLAPGAPPPIGTHVFAIGNPRGLTNTLSDGLVSGMRTFNGDGPEIPVIQTSAPISPGSSGGPLLLSDGQVIGVTSAGMDDGQNLNFAVPVEHVRKLIEARSEPLPVAVAAPRRRSAFPPPPPPPPPSLTELTPIEQVAALIEQRRFSSAMRMLRDMTDAQRKLPEYWTLLGRVQEEGFKNYEVAEDAYRQAIRIKPTYPYAHERLGRLLMARNRFDEALDCFRAQAKIAPTFAAPYRSASLVATKMGNFQQALTLIDQAIKRDADDPELHMLRAQALFELKKDEDSMAEFRIVLRTHPQSSTALSGVGDLQLRAWKTAEAKESFRKVLSLYPLNQHAHLQLGRIARHEGALRAAVEEWEKVIAYNPFSADGLAAARERATISTSALIHARN